MTTEAQNALLKTLEEPSAQATFFIIVPSPETLLPTLRSRMQTLLLTSNSATLYVVDPIGFLAASSTERLELLKPLLEKDTDERRDLAAVIEFLAGLEQVLAERTERSPEALAAIYRARKYITDKGALVKPLLEQVALLA
jgi:hypothetical protein